MRKVVLTRRQLIAVLEHNGFVARERSGTSHVKYDGQVDGRSCCVTVDESKDEFSADSHGILYYIVSSQLGLFAASKGSIKKAWERFYAGEPDLARRAQTRYRRW